MEELRVEGEAFDALREGINQCLTQMIFRMVQTGVDEGTVSAGIKITLAGDNQDDGDKVVTDPKIDFSVSYSVPYKASAKIPGPAGQKIVLRRGCRVAMIGGPKQVSMFEQEGEEQQ